MLFIHKISLLILGIVMLLPLSDTAISQDFQGRAYYFSKSKMELGAWGARMSEAQKKKLRIG